jgi:hypothetical protein
LSPSTHPLGCWCSFEDCYVLEIKQTAIILPLFLVQTSVVRASLCAGSDLLFRNGLKAPPNILIFCGCGIGSIEEGLLVTGAEYVVV